jgi:hypothetical protein
MLSELLAAHRHGRTPPWLFALAFAVAAAAAFMVWLAHPRDWIEVVNLVLAGVILEVAGLVLIAPIGLITGAYRKRPQDFGASRRRPFGLVALVMIGVIGFLYLFANNMAWLPVLGSPDLWRYPPWDGRWAGYWVKQVWGTGLYFALFLASALVQLAWDHLEQRHWRKIAERRPTPILLDGD